MEDKLNANKLNTKMRHEINMAADEIKQQKSALKKKIEVIARLVSTKRPKSVSIWNVNSFFV